MHEGRDYLTLSLNYMPLMRFIDPNWDINVTQSASKVLQTEKSSVELKMWSNIMCELVLIKS